MHNIVNFNNFGTPRYSLPLINASYVSRNLRLYIVLIGAANRAGSFGAQLGSTVMSPGDFRRILRITNDYKRHDTSFG